jgi:hypothetical protein
MNANEKAKTIIASHKAGEGSIKELCKKHAMNPAYFYQVRKKLAPKSKKVKVIKKRKYTKRAKMMDIPLVSEAPTKYYIVVCESADAVRKLVG